MKLLTFLTIGFNHAGSKAPADVIKIVMENFDNVEIETLEIKNTNNALEKILNIFRKYITIRKVKNYKKMLIVQYPISPLMFLKFIPANSIILIHDLAGLRELNEKLENKEIKYLKKFEYLIVHNNSMKNYLIKNGIKKEKIFVLELFDYLAKRNLKKHNINEITIDYVGNLTLKKCPFIYQLGNDNKFNINLYGNGIDGKIENSKIKYIGNFLPDKIVENLQGNIGLVWDGKIDSSDEYEYRKNYMKYNNPHKLSCYIAAEIPVIVWKKAAVADFVKKYNIGYTISDIYDINNIDFSDYNEKLENVQRLGKKVRNGYFTKRVLEKILKNIGEINEI